MAVARDGTEERLQLFKKKKKMKVRCESVSVREEMDGQVQNRPDGKRRGRRSAVGRWLGW